MALTTAAAVKSHLGIVGSTHDTLLGSLVTQVDLFVELETGVKTGAASGNLDITNEIADHDGSLTVVCKHKPINSVTKIEYKISVDTWEEYDDETIGSVDTHKEKIFTQYYVTGKGKRNLRLTYNAGYITANVPEDLQLCAILIIATLFNHRNQVGFDNINILGLSQTMSKNDYIFIKKILTKYKKCYAI